jgi:hypothetical protein
VSRHVVRKPSHNQAGRRLEGQHTGTSQRYDPSSLPSRPRPEASTQSLNQAVTCASYQHRTRAQSSRRAHVSVCGLGAGKPVLSRFFSTLDRAETVPVACPSERRTRVIRGHSRAKPIPADLHRRCSAEPPPEPSKLVMRVRFPSPAPMLPAQLRYGFPVIAAHLTERATGSACHTRATTTADVMRLARLVHGLMPVSRRRLALRGRTRPEPSRSPGHGHGWRAGRSWLRGRWSARDAPSAP